MLSIYKSNNVRCVDFLTLNIICMSGFKKKKQKQTAKGHLLGNNGWCSAFKLCSYGTKFNGVSKEENRILLHGNDEY